MARDLLSRKWMAMDIECIQLGKDRKANEFSPGYYAKIHQCKRKMGVVLYTGQEFLFEASPCIKESELKFSEKQSYDFARKKLHNGDFPFYPKKGFRRCRDMGRLIRRMIADYGIEILVFKGGNVEHDFVLELGIRYKNLEDFGVKKVDSHEPLE